MPVHVMLGASTSQELPNPNIEMTLVLVSSRGGRGKLLVINHPNEMTVVSL